MKRRGFTITELLVVMSIIIILMSILLPSVAMVRRHAKTVKQKMQFKLIDEGLRLFEYEQGYMPDSYLSDMNGDMYCGAMKLCEALMGQDGLGFHRESTFTADDGVAPNELYPVLPPAMPYTPEYKDNLNKRAKYVDIEKFTSYRIGKAYKDGVGSFDADCAVLSDVYARTNIVTANSKKRVGMPILYYRPTEDIMHDLDAPDNPDNRYSFRDNHELLKLGTHTNGTYVHDLYQKGTDPEAKVFYEMTQNKKVSSRVVPHNYDGYILISAGHDMVYGTNDDVTNF